MTKFYYQGPAENSLRAIKFFFPFGDQEQLTMFAILEVIDITKKIERICCTTSCYLKLGFQTKMSQRLEGVNYVITNGIMTDIAMKKWFNPMEFMVIEHEEHKHYANT